MKHPHSSATTKNVFLTSALGYVAGGDSREGRVAVESRPVQVARDVQGHDVSGIRFKSTANFERNRNSNRQKSFMNILICCMKKKSKDMSRKNERRFWYNCGIK